jgi:hypothetical protein
MIEELERLARAADAAEDAVIAAAGQHREDLWTAAHDARRAFHDAADFSTVLRLLEVVKQAKRVIADLDRLAETGYETEAALRAALAGLEEGK